MFAIGKPNRQIVPKDQNPGLHSSVAGFFNAMRFRFFCLKFKPRVGYTAGKVVLEIEKGLDGYT
jgi:hypothetical protein